MSDHDSEDAKLVTLARGAMARAEAASGAAVRDRDGRTYAGTPVTLKSLGLTALQAAVAAAVSSGATGLEAAVLVVEADDVGVASPQTEAGISFPGRVEAVDPVELDGAEGVDEVAEHAGATDGRELHRVTEQSEAPTPSLGQLDQLGEAWCRHHRGLVHHDGGAGREVVAALGRAVA